MNIPPFNTTEMPESNQRVNGQLSNHKKNLKTSQIKILIKNKKTKKIWQVPFTVHNTYI